MSYSEPALHQHITTKKQLSLFDKVVIVASFVYPLSATPQVLEVFAGHTSGVSAIPWIGFLVCALLFLIYGVKHKITPMIIANSLWVVMDGLVIVGIMTK